MSPRTAPVDIKNRRAEWFKDFKIWRRIFYALGIVGVVFSLTVTAFTNFIGEWPIRIFSFGAALSSGLATLLNPTKRAKAYITAWRLLDGEILTFESDESYSGDKLVQAVKAGEDIIAKTDD